MSDFSLFSLFTAGLACLVPFANAYTQPVGDSPEGNPIYTPGLHDVVPAGVPYTITWDPTTEGTVTLVLLKGPSTNAVPQYAIVEAIPNTGNYIWTPATDLVPTSGDTGYGIQLIVDATGQYQYTTQFGISNPDYSGSPSGSPSGYGSASGVVPSSTHIPTGYAHPTGGYAHPTGSWGHANATHPKPTGHYTKPKHTLTTKAPESSVMPAPSSAKPTPPEATPTGGAANVATSLFGLVAAAGVAVFAL